MSHKDPEVRRAYLRDWRANNRDKVNATNKAWRKSNPKKHASSVMKQRYGIDHVERDAMLAQQGGCAVCGSTEENKWHVDHSHATGKVRGILCHNCNVGLGHFKDNPEVIRAAIAYLRKHQ